MMSVPVFRCVSARHYRFEGKEKMGTHLIIKILRIYFKIRLKTSTCSSYGIYFPVKRFERHKTKKKKNSIQNAVKSSS